MVVRAVIGRRAVLVARSTAAVTGTRRVRVIMDARSERFVGERRGHRLMVNVTIPHGPDQRFGVSQSTEKDREAGNQSAPHASMSMHGWRLTSRNHHGNGCSP